MKTIERQVEEYLVYCERVWRMTEATMVVKRNVLTRFVRVTRLDDLGKLTNDVFNKWVEHETGRGASARSVNTYNSVVLAMVRYYRGVGVVIPLNIPLIGKLKEGRLRRNFYTSEEIERVVACADFETGLQIKMMFETGMRIAELTRLRVSDFEGRRIRFIGKGRKPREVYITDETLRWLNEYIQRYGVKDYLWGAYGGVLTLNGEPPTVNTVRQHLKRPFIAAGLTDFYPHSLRHSFATDLQLRGASVAEIREMIGHESVSTTERYLHGFEGRLEELFDKYR